MSTVERTIKLSDFNSILLAIASGLLTAIAFPTFDVGFFAWVSLIPLLFALEEKTPSQAFLLSYLSGTIIFAVQMSWLGTSHPALPVGIAMIAALYIGIFGFLYRFIQDSFPISPLLVMPIIWITSEFARMFGPLAFPVGMLGYSQHSYLAIIQIADLGGIYGLSFMIALVNVAIFSILKSYYVHHRVFQSFVTVMVIITAVLGYGFSKLDYFTSTANENFKIAIIQPNIGYYEKGYDALKALDRVAELTARASLESPDLIVWPEAIIKGDSLSDPGVLQKLNRIVGRQKGYLLYGAPRVDSFGGNTRVYSSVVLSSPKQKQVGIYNKRHLVPFADTMTEYLSALGISRGVFAYAPGNEFTIFRLPKATFAATICFDGLFPDLVGKFVSNGAQFMVNVADDSWSNSIAEHFQHASMSIFRAVENRIYYVRAANSGISMVIDPKGFVINALPPFKQGYIVTNIGTNKGQKKTFYNQHGDFVAFISFGATFFLAIVALLLGFINYYRQKKI